MISEDSRPSGNVDGPICPRGWLRIRSSGVYLHRMTTVDPSPPGEDEEVEYRDTGDRDKEPPPEREQSDEDDEPGYEPDVSET
jgi:hypothetical protein